MKIPGNLTSEDDLFVTGLRARMDSFYQSTQNYSAFQKTSELPDQWRYVREAILAVLKQKPICRILEIGSGRSGFGEFVQDLKPALHYTAQDVTRANADHLWKTADAVHVGSAAQLEGEFDVIFSTFVLEHISDPRQTLEHLFSLLPRGGKLFIFCPRYDVPFYLSHSADHYSIARRFGISVALVFVRLWALLSRRALFLIHTDPAVFYLPFFRDRDAIHWTSLWDLQSFFHGRGSMRRLKMKSANMKDWIVKNLLQISVEITCG